MPRYEKNTAKFTNKQLTPASLENRNKPQPLAQASGAVDTPMEYGNSSYNAYIKHGMTKSSRNSYSAGNIGYPTYTDSRQQRFNSQVSMGGPGGTSPLYWM